MTDTTTRYFDENYRDYFRQNPDHKLDFYLDQLIRRGAADRATLLDIGCGKGAFLARSSGRMPSWRLLGIEPEKDGVDHSSHLVPNAAVTSGVATELPFADDSTDIVTAWDVLEHVPKVEDALDEILRVLRPGGTFGFVVPVYDGLTGPLIKLLDNDPTHVHKHGRHWWLEAVGSRFDDLEWCGIFRYLIGPRYLHLPTIRWRSNTPAILVTATPRRPQD